MKILMLGSGSVRSNFMYRLLALGKALKRRGHEVTIIAPKADKYNDFTPENITDIEGVRILQPFQFATKRLEINLLPYMVDAMRLVLREKPDLVYIYKPTPISIVGLVSKLFRRTPTVLDMDDLGSEVMQIEGHPAHQRKLVEWSERLAARCADQLVVASTFLRDMHRKKFPKKPVHVLPNGVEPEWFATPAKKGARKKQIVFMGALNRPEILEPLFDALPLVIKKHPSVHALIIGDGQYLDYFKKKVKELGLTSHVTFTGWLKLEAAQKLLRAGDLGYNYMPDARTVRAASNMKVPQYMARGVVPLVSKVGDLPWMVDNGKAGYLATAGNTDELSQVLIHALGDAARTRKSGNARRYAQKTFDWDKLAEGVDNVLINRRTSSRLKAFLTNRLTWLTIGLGITNVLVHTGADFWHLGKAFITGYMLVAPGLLLLSFLTKKKMLVPLGLALSAALSIALLMAAGLFVNFVLPWAGGIDHPLVPAYLLAAFDGLMLILLSVSLFTGRTLPLKAPKFSKLDAGIIAGALFMPALAVLGATSLNNGGPNVFTMCGIGLIAAYVPLLIWLRARLNVSVLPVILYLMGLALLLMNSMRGWSITGHDVLREYHVFQLTFNAGRWDIAAFRDPYNACLSITLLPTYLQNFLHIDPAYIYKFVFQLIGALPIIPIFYLFKRFVSASIAFLAGFTYISFPAFIIDMSMLNRQSVGFLFFSLLLYVLLTNYYVVKRERLILLTLLGTGMVVSHYSTSYVTVTLLLAAYLGAKLLRWTIGRGGKLNKLRYWLFKLPNYPVYRHPALLSLPFVAGMLIVAALWNGPVTQTSKGITATITQIVESVQKPFGGGEDDAAGEGEPGPAKYSIVKDKDAAEATLFEQFVAQGIEEERTPENESNLFPLKTAQDPRYAATAAEEPITPTGPVGSALERTFSVDLHSIYQVFKQGYAGIVQLLIVIGLAGLLIGYSFRRLVEVRLPLEYLTLAAAGVLFIAFQVLVPQSGIDYGILRLLQQNLMLLALPVVLAFMWLVGFVLRKAAWQLFAYGTVAAGFFLMLSGFIPQLTGGTRPALALNNDGLYYDAYLVHEAEIASFAWVKTSAIDPHYTIQSDRFFTALKLHAYTSIPGGGSRLLPETVKRNSFVVLSTTNMQGGTVVEYQGGDIVYYRVPLAFLDDHKDLIYSTRGSAVYW